MNNNKIKDERIVQQQHKICSDAFQLISMFLLASMMYKHFILNAPISASMTEFIAFFGGSAYVVLRNIMIGNNINGDYTTGTKKHGIKNYLMNSLISSLTITTVLLINDYKRYMQNKEIIILTFLCMFAFWFLSHWGLNYLSKKRADKITKQYEEEQ